MTALPIEEWDANHPRPHTCRVCKVGIEHHRDRSFGACSWYREDRRSESRETVKS